jgi:hypothetical protein
MTFHKYLRHKKEKTESVMTKQLPSNRNLAMGRLILVILVFSLVGIIVYRYYMQSKGGTFTNVPKELQINYVPSDFELDLDEEKKY